MRRTRPRIKARTGAARRSGRWHDHDCEAHPAFRVLFCHERWTCRVRGTAGLRTSYRRSRAVSQPCLSGSGGVDRMTIVRRASNPPNPWLDAKVEYLDEVPLAPLEVFEDHTRSILSRNDPVDPRARRSSSACSRADPGDAPLTEAGRSSAARFAMHESHTARDRGAVLKLTAATRDSATSRHVIAPPARALATNRIPIGSRSYTSWLFVLSSDGRTFDERHSTPG
jgi:hypothetical protein